MDDLAVSRIGGGFRLFSGENMAILLTTKEVSTLTGIPESTLRKWRVNGVGPKFRRPVGSRKVSYHQTDINEWLEQSKYQSTSEYAVQLAKITNELADKTER